MAVNRVGKRPGAGRSRSRPGAWNARRGGNHPPAASPLRAPVFPGMAAAPSQAAAAASVPSPFPNHAACTTSFTSTSSVSCAQPPHLGAQCQPELPPHAWPSFLPCHLLACFPHGPPPPLPPPFVALRLASSHDSAGRHPVLAGMIQSRYHVLGAACTGLAVALAPTYSHPEPRRQRLLRETPPEYLTGEAFTR
jgi:hypothetical protein